MFLKNTFLFSLVLFSLVGCSNNKTSDCDPKKYNCEPIASEVLPASDAIVATSDVISPVEASVLDVAVAQDKKWSVDPKVEAALPALFSSEVDPDFDWSIEDVQLVEDGSYTGVDTIRVTTYYHYKQAPLICDVDVMWIGGKFDLSLTNRNDCVANYPNAN